MVKRSNLENPSSWISRNQNQRSPRGELGSSHFDTDKDNIRNKGNSSNTTDSTGANDSFGGVASNGASCRRPQPGLEEQLNRWRAR